MNDTDLQIIVKAVDEASSVLQGVSDKLGGVQKAADSMGTSWKEIGETTTKVGLSMAGVGAAILAPLALSVKEAQQAEAIQARLAQTLRTSTHATDDQIQALNDQAEALENIGVVSADVIRQGQGQLAAFDLQSESIKKLIPSILNYATAEKGMNMTTQDLQAVTNGLAQALQGNFASLTKTGFVLDENTKALISNGTETERVAALAKVLDSTYAGMNETLRKTAAGGVVGLQFSLNKLAQTVGDILIPVLDMITEKIAPILQRIVQWIEAHKKITQAIVLTVGAIGVILVVFGTLAAAVGGLILLLTSTAGIITGAVVTAIIALGAATIAVILDWKKFVVVWTSIWEEIKTVASDTWNWINSHVIQPMLSAFDKITQNSIVKGAINVGNAVLGGLNTGLKAVGFAEGGIVTSPTLAMVGEGGESEAIIPLSKLAGFGGPNVTLNVNGGYYLDERAARDFGQKLVNQLQRVSKVGY